MKTDDIRTLLADIKAVKKKADFLSPANCLRLVGALDRALVVARPPSSTEWRKLRRTLWRWGHE